MKYYFFRDTDNESNLLDGKTYHASGYVEKLYCELGKPNTSGKDIVVSFCEPFEGRKEPLIRLADILTLVPKLSSRLYSISSSDIMTPRTVAITVGVVNFHTQAMVRVEGVCSNQLASLQPGDHVEGKVVKSFLNQLFFVCICTKI